MGEITLEKGVAQLPREEWNVLVGEGSPFLEWEWLASLEEAEVVHPSTGWLPRPLVARDAGRLVAACPLYVKAHSEGEFVFDFAWADAAERAGLRYYPKLLVGVPFTPVCGARILTAPGVARASWIQRFGAALRALCVEQEFSSVHVNFCEEDEVTPLEAAGFHTRLGFQYQWCNRGYTSFEDFLTYFRSKRRNQILRERRELRTQSITLETLVGTEIPSSLFDPMFRLYCTTVDQHPWGRRYLNEAFFELLRQRFRQRLCCILAKQGDQIIAGTLNVQKNDVLYGRYWGAFHNIRHLHFNVCYYAALEHCIRNGLQRFEPGAGGEFKQLRGFDAAPTRSLHFIADPRLAAAVERFLEQERSQATHAIEALRERSALKSTQGRRSS